ncbi:MAG: neutral zinc metallopeptidase [Alphaproteobacteria bacterium CG_4_10_14_0_2_um_filter_63_37]|nr:MAG: neutral zinc metallopeptidase [Alphaproteobacteria bacterium CG_4_10_14_0_2_um_filter_63_37]
MKIFEQEVTRAMAGLPQPFRDAIENVAFFVEDRPDADTLEEMEIDDPDGLLGLYRGIPMEERGSWYAGALPDTIHLYRRPILKEASEFDLDVVALIQEVVIHEVGHYFGFSDEEMEAIMEASVVPTE